MSTASVYVAPSTSIKAEQDLARISVCVVKLHTTAILIPSISMDTWENVADLVCCTCWENFFNTQQYQTLCLCLRTDAHYDEGVRDKKTVQEIVKSATDGCNWCSYLLTFTSSTDEAADPEDVLCIYLGNFYPHYSTPTGRNSFYLSLDLEKCRSDRSPGWALRLHAFTDDSNPAAKLVTARKLQHEVHSDAARVQVQNWLLECTEHNLCPKQVETELPTRVIEVDPAGQSSEPRLLVTSGMQGRYAALSYCWGSGLYGELNQSNLPDYTKRLDLESIPQALRDAITVAKSLSIPYLWIDALCIIQDSEHDKEHEISMMERVYKDALLTITVASSDSATKSFLEPRGQLTASFDLPFRLSESQFGTISVGKLDDMEYEESSEPINKRAWTLQESLLSSRYLVYSSHTLQWRCKAGVRNLGDSLHIVSYAEEDQYSESLLNMTKSESDPDKELKRWIRLVHIYSERSASLPQDKLNAISAVAKRFASTLGPTYYAGMWQYAILWQLTWVTRCSWSASAINRRPAIFRAPSWSWASIDGDLYYESYMLEEDTDRYLYRCNFISCSTQLKSTGIPFGEVLGGSLKLSGVLRPAWFKPSSNQLLWLLRNDETLDEVERLQRNQSTHDDSANSGDGESSTEIETTAFYDESGSWPPVFVFCLPISAHEKKISIGLILTQEGDGAFRRIGSFANANTQDFDYILQREIILV